MNRGWGWQLLPRGDKAFYEPRYLSSLLRESAQTGHGMTTAEPTRAISVFREAWQKIAPKNVHAKAFTLTGSDANNLVYAIALENVRRRLGSEHNQADVLVLDGAYGGGRGRIAGAGFLPFGKDGAPDQSHLMIKSPVSYELNPKNRQEVARLKKLEDAALASIQEKIRTNKVPIGGLFLEPILGAKGVLFYRSKFLRKLRALCDEHKIPIIADEVLTGGGRTGKFFAYQHYHGFEPDFVTFGKGLQVAGLARVNRKKAPSHPAPAEMVTLTATSESLLKATQVMNRIHDDKLMDNAREVGAYLVERLKQRDRGGTYDPPSTTMGSRTGPARGIGLLVFSANPGHLMGAQGRLMPFLSISKKDIDTVLDAKAEGAAGRSRTAPRR